MRREKAADALRNTINSEFSVPETVSELVTHYRKYELTEEKKAYATIEANTLYLTNHIVPKWGTSYLQDVRTVDVELWLHTLKFAPGTRSKIRNIMSAVFNHAIRHEWMDRNPIAKVRVSAKRLREPDVLTPAEIASLTPCSTFGNVRW
jgi:site-specific recombinase XerD